LLLLREEEAVGTARDADAATTEGLEPIEKRVNVFTRGVRGDKANDVVGSYFGSGGDSEPHHGDFVMCW
jgi:hypothetical protein